MATQSENGLDDAGGRYEAALRRLPDAHSLALRLRHVGVADDVICQYLQIEPEGLPGLLDLARLKLQAEFTSLDVSRLDEP
jgi:hypothetical protein